MPKKRMTENVKKKEKIEYQPFGARELELYVWSGHCLIASMQVLYQEVYPYPEGERREVRDLAAEADGHADAYEALGEMGGGAATNVMRFFSYLSLNFGSVLDCASKILRITRNSGSARTDSLRMAVSQDAAVFEKRTEWTQPLVEWLGNQIKSGVYDLEMLRMAKKLDVKIRDWYEN